jgi:hypothetical protein
MGGNLSSPEKLKKIYSNNFRRKFYGKKPVYPSRWLGMNSHGDLGAETSMAFPLE